MKFLNDKKRRWQKHSFDNCTVWFVGRMAGIDKLVEAIKEIEQHGLKMLGKLLKAEHGCFSCVIEGDGFIFAAVDRIRSYPLFYTTNNNFKGVSNNARILQKQANLDSTNSMSLLEFTMAGYITGEDTVITGLNQLQAGEALILNNHTNSYQTIRYGQYFPQPQAEPEDGYYLNKLETVMDNVFNRMIEQADGAPIWVPLSGGLDSRLIVCKLKELGYEDVQTYSYGALGNHEARNARDVAKTLELPWRFIRSNTNEASQLFSSKIRQDYWSFADGLSSQPPVSMLQSLILLKEEGAIPKNAVFINGQSGDFITGGHVPKKLLLGDSPSEETLLDIIIEKHFSLWKHYYVDNNLAQIREKTKKIFESWGIKDVSRNGLIARYEAWECQERQCKYVVNGQRLYDFLELDWLLPHWDTEVIDFWGRVPFELKYGQKLYKEYLLRYDYRGLFSREYLKPSTWPREKEWVPWVARMIGLVLGSQVKESFYHKMFYYGVYHNQYALMGRRYYLNHYDNASGVISFLVDHWLNENKLSRPVGDKNRE